MVITSLQEKQNRKFYVPIRPGNRGGWSLFEWQSVRQKPYRDREMYLGNSAVIGVLDRGGKWRKRDWYLKTQKKYNDPNLKSEQEEAIRKDMERMNSALGLGDAQQDDQKLNQQQMRELLKKIKNKDVQAPSGAAGLGFDKSRVEIRAKPNAKTSNTNRLQGIDQIGDDSYKNDRKQRPKKQSPSRSRERRRQKSDKKHRRQKKSKRERTPSSDSQKSAYRHRRNKHRRKYSDSSSSSSDRHKSKKAYRRHESSSEDERPRRREKQYDRRYRD